MQHEKRVVKGSQKEVDVPLKDLYNISSYIEEAFGYKFVIIGGRAINLQNLGSSRPTHDVDGAVLYRPTAEQLRALPDVSGPDGMFFTMDRDPESLSRVKITYHSPTVASVVEEEHVEIDLYYPGYRSTVNQGMPRSDINGLPIRAIIDQAETIRHGDMEFHVASRPHLMIMKYETWLSRGAGRFDSKDFRDIINTIRNHYNSPEEFTKFIDQLRTELRKHIPDREKEVIKGILTNVDFGKINSELASVAKGLERQ